MQTMDEQNLLESKRGARSVQAPRGGNLGGITRTSSLTILAVVGPGGGLSWDPTGGMG